MIFQGAKKWYHWCKIKKETEKGYGRYKWVKTFQESSRDLMNMKGFWLSHDKQCIDCKILLLENKEI